nr:probable N-acetylglucosaminyl-phosphatidylinositol de-N-acetylase [Ipomoea trifida]
MGDTRKQELYLAAATLKVSPQQVNILDHPDLQDGFGKFWNSDLLAGIVKEEVDSHSIDVDTSHKNVEAWELVSTNILRKYIGPVDIWLSILYAKLHPNRQVHFFINERPRKSYAAMAQHRSQWVWFRKLFVSFSSYTFVNSLKKINN